MSLSTFFFVAIALATLLGLVVLYNQLVRLRNTLPNAFAQIDVQLKRRYELIPNLVEVARAYMAHERDTLQAVTQARKQAESARSALHAKPPLSAQSSAALMGADAALQGALAQFYAVAENYPELKADQNLRDLSEEITHTENSVGFARQAYNDAALAYNNAAGQFPGVLVARLFGFAPMPMLQSTTSDAQRETMRIAL